MAGGETVLVVDDDREFLLELSDCLNSRGFSTIAVDNVVSALQAVLCKHPDLLVADWMLRDDLDGIQLALLGRAFDPQLETLVVTGMMPTDAQKGRVVRHPISFLEKPFELEALFGALTDLTENRRASPAEGTAADELIGVFKADRNGQIEMMSDACTLLLPEVQVGSLLTDVAATLCDGESPGEYREGAFTRDESRFRFFRASAGSSTVIWLATETNRYWDAFRLCQLGRKLFGSQSGL
ncbi:MAG: response regulator [Bdellovibrionales bacterium]|nr:response regulator [Bdellovibrionales bacterium]